MKIIRPLVEKKMKKQKDHCSYVKVDNCSTHTHILDLTHIIDSRMSNFVEKNFDDLYNVFLSHVQMQLSTATCFYIAWDVY